MNTISKTVVGLLFAASAAFSGEYNVDTTHSQVGFSVKHLGISSVNGTFSKFGGEYNLDEKTLILKSLLGTVETATVNTANEKRDEHLKSADFFDVQKFPAMKLSLVSASKNKIVANLTIKNVTKRVVFNYVKGGVAKDPFSGTQKSSFTFSGQINRKDFGLTWNKILEAGGLAVGDIVTITVNIEGSLKK